MNMCAASPAPTEPTRVATGEQREPVETMQLSNRAPAGRTIEPQCANITITDNVRPSGARPILPH